MPDGTWTTQALPPRYTLANFASLVTEAERLRPLLNSLWMAAVASAAAVAAALLAGHPRRAPRDRRLARPIEWLLALPWVVPGTVLAIGLATTFGVTRPLAGRFVLVGTAVILPLAYFVRSLPLTRPRGARRLPPARPRARGGGAVPSAPGAGSGCGASPSPVLRPALAAGGSFAFVTALGDFVTSVLLYTYGTRPISIEILLQHSASSRSARRRQFGVVLMAVSAGARRRRGAGGSGPVRKALWVLMAAAFVVMMGFAIVFPLLPFYALRLRRSSRG